MNKAQLVEKMAQDAEISKSAASKALDSFMSNVADSVLKQGSAVSLVGFGTFKLANRAARTGRNPQTGETIEIKASRSVAFKPGKTLKENV